MENYEDLLSQRHLHSHFHSNIIHNSWCIETKYSSADAHMHKMCLYTHTVEEHSAKSQDSQKTCRKVAARTRRWGRYGEVGEKV